MPLPRLWVGDVFGTNVGGVFVEFAGPDDALTAEVRFNDRALGPVVYAATGQFDGSDLTLTASPKAVLPGQGAGQLEMSGALNPRGELEGKWTSNVGTGGTFLLLPQGQQRAPVGPPVPEQLHTVVREVGAVRLAGDDIRSLIDILAKDFRQPRVVATYQARGSEVSRYADDFLADFEQIGALDFLKLGTGEPDAFGLSRNAEIVLSARAANVVRVQAVQEAWALGKAETLIGQLRRYEKPVVTNLRRYGGGLPTLALLAVVTVLPELPLPRRVLFLIGALFVAGAASWAHRKFVPNAAILLRRPAQGIWERMWPQVLSWLIAASSAVAASLIYAYLSGLDFKWARLLLDRIQF